MQILIPSRYIRCLLFVLIFLILYSGYTAAESGFNQPSAREESHRSFRIGYRQDQLDWNIASDLSGYFTPNILSELSWREIESPQLIFEQSGFLSSHFYYRISAAAAVIVTGENQDSDYDGNNRTLEFSRSNNNASDGFLADFSGAIGSPFWFGQTTATSVRVTPLIGYSYHRQNLTMTEGMQTVATSGRTPPLGSIPGLDSTYEAEWYGLWWGFELIHEISPRVGVAFIYEHHEGEFLGVGNWNLRSDFKHPRSFEHVADASGDILVLNLSVRSDYPWSWLFSVQLQEWQADPGIDRIFFSDDTVGITRLNEVNWQASSISIGFLITL